MTYRFAAMIAVMMLVGCASQEEQVVGSAPVGGAAIERPKPAPPPAPEQPKYPRPALVVNTWPYVEVSTTFSLIWQGGSKAALLHTAPDPNAPIVGEVTWEQGEKILWRDTVVAVYAPRVATATDEWFVEGPIHAEGYIESQEFSQIELRKGDRLSVWAYAGDNQCYLSHRGPILVGPCPPTDRFRGLGVGQVRAERYMAQTKMWWIQITGANMEAWVAVDDRMAVDIVDE